MKPPLSNPPPRLPEADPASLDYWRGAAPAPSRVAPDAGPPPRRAAPRSKGAAAPVLPERPPPARGSDTSLDASLAAFGWPSFRAGQREACEALESGRDVSVLLPTGGGKSLCYQLPAVRAWQAGRGRTVVVSPLVALMDDQVAALKRRGIPAVALHRSLSPEDRERARAEAGEAALIYASPERLASAPFRRWLQRLGVAYVAVDEAHCVSEWGHDFRPEYRQLSVLRDEWQVPMVALTATATPSVLDDIRGQLGLVDPVAIRASFRRDNLAFHVEHHSGDKSRTERLITLVREVGAEGRVVIYAATRKRVKAVYEALRDARVAAGFYHAGRTDSAREKAQDAFETGKSRVLVATSAFGMGVDLPDIRLVVHAQTPGSIEGYWQEAGRAGRDGRPSDCVLLFASSDRMIWQRLAGASGVARFGLLERWATAPGCRQSKIQAHFGEIDVACGRCDACLAPEATLDAANTAIAAMNRKRKERDDRKQADESVRLDPAAEDTIVAFVGGMSRPVGKRLVAQGLRGSRAKPVLRRKLTENRHFGALAHLPEVAIVRSVEFLLAEGRLAPKGKKYPTVWLPSKPVRGADAGAPRRPRPGTTGLEGSLRAWRRNESRKRRWKPYQVFDDKTMQAIIAERPATLTHLALIPGIGPRRLETFGVRILELVASNPS